jgi:hypothetical protein
LVKPFLGAVLPWQALHAAVDELDRAVTELDLKGVLIAGRPGNTFSTMRNMRRSCRS